MHKLISQRLDGVPSWTIAAGEDVLVYFRYKKQIEEAVRDFQQAQNIEDLKASYKGGDGSCKDLQKTPDPRKVIWMVDETGNSGKTYLTKYLMR